MQYSDSSSKSLQWTLCLIIASVVSLSSFWLSLPLCLGCIITQSFLWLRLILRSRMRILLCFLAMLTIQGMMLWSAFVVERTCLFDSETSISSCGSAIEILFMGYPFVLWSFMGTFLMLLWSWSWKD